MQTLKFAAMRAGNDPDRDGIDHGTYYGVNVPGKFRLPGKNTSLATTRGAFRKRGSK